MKKRIFFHTWHVPPWLPLLLLLAACNVKEEAPRSVAGRVLEHGTDKPLQGALVKVYECDSEFLGSISCYAVDSARTDASGAFAMPELFNDAVQRANAFLPGYFTDWESEACVCYPVDKLELRLHPHAWLKVTLRNESGAYKITTPGEDLTSTGKSHMLAKGDETTVNFFRKGNTVERYIFSVILEQGQSGTTDLSRISIIQSDGIRITPSLENSAAPWFNIYLPGHDTTNLTIVY
jgi:hypothetical protein